MTHSLAPVSAMTYHKQMFGQYCESLTANKNRHPA